MAKPLVPDELWELIRLLLPPKPQCFRSPRAQTDRRPPGSFRNDPQVFALAGLVGAYGPTALAEDGSLAEHRAWQPHALTQTSALVKTSREEGNSRDVAVWSLPEGLLGRE
jgi:hypothetical protein